LARIQFERKIGPKGEVVIPKEIRRIMGISPNSKVLIGVEDGSIVIKKEGEEPVWRFMTRFAKEHGKRLSVKELNKMKEEHYQEELGETTAAFS
jgi:AbrB family looped-hinge helix DNA binding protein